MQKKQPDISQHRRDKNLRILDERQELLDTIRKIIRMEVNKQKQESDEKFHTIGLLRYLRNISNKIRRYIRHMLYGNST